MKVLIGVDASPASLAAVHHALALRRQQLRIEFVLVNVQEPPSLYEVVTAHDAQALSDVRRAAGEDLLSPAESLLRAAGAEWESEVAGGQAVNLIPELAENYGCDAIVLGRGETALEIARQSTLPVTLVPAPADEGG
jgi:nucleotide-binding universal stress UspA family protein